MEGQSKSLDKHGGEGLDEGEMVSLDHLYLTTVWRGFALNGLSSSDLIFFFDCHNLQRLQLCLW